MVAPVSIANGNGEFVLISYHSIEAYEDEFTIAIRDTDGRYQSWPKIPSVKVQIDAPAEAHAELLGQYSDADIHNLMAYLQTLK